MKNLDSLTSMVNNYNKNTSHSTESRRKDNFMCKELVVTDGLICEIIIPGLVLLY